MEKEVTKVSYDTEKQELKLTAGSEVVSEVSLAFSGDGIEETIRGIVREEIAAHEERLDGKRISEALGKYLKERRKSTGDFPNAFDTQPELE